ncbi:protein kinase domain-containing protein [Yinghuangia seranimata]|uniref:protein kinase domain-containing protein n=1 Tax=Yinghuangia seranimata TaxID=408067 RepID=UPI00248B9E01|nr:protein kinase [Yinghuangia seranimata]MDI2128342.1 protein kinase [Yinghuangia seranimata]
MEPLDPADPTRVGSYWLLGVLGSGGMGKVYLGRSAAGRTVAVKVVRPDLASDGGFRGRFRAEVTAARRVSSAFTAPVVDADVDGEPPWMATRFVAGLTLHEAVRRHGPLPETTLRMLLAGIAEALENIHSAGVVHRDLKPGNVILALDGPHVVDFGIARALDAATITPAGAVVGTPGYLSPEQAIHRPATSASDVFALGATVAFAASGQPVFGRGSVPEVLRRVVQEQPDLAAVPASIRDTVAACLGKQPERRPTPRALIDFIDGSGTHTAGGSWLPPGLTADIMAADAVMTGAQSAGDALPPGPTPQEAPTASVVPTALPTAPAPAFPTTLPTAPAPAFPTTPTNVPERPSVAPPLEDPPPSGINRRKLLLGLAAGGALIAGGGAAAVALTSGGGSGSGRTASATQPASGVPGGATPSASGEAAAAAPPPPPPTRDASLPAPGGAKGRLDGPEAAVKWKATTLDTVSSTSFEHGLLITAAASGRQTFDITGKPWWTLATSSRYQLFAAATSSDATSIYVMQGGQYMGGSLIAVDPLTGKQQWTVPLPGTAGHVTALLGVVGNTMLVTGSALPSGGATGSGFLWAVDVPSRSTAWEIDGDDVGFVCVPTTGTKVLMGGKSGATGGVLKLIDAANKGAPGWLKQVRTANFQQMVFTDPICWAGGRFVYAADKVYAVDPESGEEAWAFTDGAVFPMFMSCFPSADGSVVFVTTMTDLVCLDARDGSVRWKVATSGKLNPTVLIQSDFGNVYVLDRSQVLWAIDIATGTTRWHYATGGGTDPLGRYWTAGGGMVFVNKDKTITAIDASGA